MKLTPASRAESTMPPRLGRVGAVAEHHRAQAERRDLQAAAAESPVFHRHPRNREKSGETEISILYSSASGKSASTTKSPLRSSVQCPTVDPFADMSITIGLPC